MQAAQATMPYLQNPVSMKKDYVPEEGRSDQKSSFSDTLKQGLSKETGPAVDNAANKEPVQQQNETVQETQPETPVEGVVVQIVPNMIQNPYIPQETASETVAAMASADGAAVSEVPATLVIPAEQQNPVNREMSAMMGNADIDGAAEVLPKQAIVSELRPIKENPQIQAAPHPQQKTENPEQETIQQPVASIGKTVETQVNQTQPNLSQQNQAQQGQNQTGRETADIKNPELVQVTDRQDISVSRPTAFQTPQTGQQTSVDMTNLRTGIQNLAQTMAKHMTAGKNVFEIWLEPANLGKMAIKVAYEGGRAMVSIMCTNEKTMELISQNARQLGNILQQHTGDDTVVVIDHPESDYLQQKADQEQQSGHQQEESENKQSKNQQQDADHESFLQQLRLGLM